MLGMAEPPSNTLIIHHEIDDSFLWPPELLHITNRFTQPLTLPSNVAPEHLSPNALEIYNEITELPKNSRNEEIESGLPSQLSDVLDTVLTSVKMLRELSSSVSHFGIPHPTFPVWGSLLGVLSLACFKDAILMADVPFLLPRTIPLSIEPERPTLEGRASLLIALYVSPKEDMRDVMNEDSSISSAKDSSGTTTSKTSYMSLPGPVDGHILPGRGRRVDCVLPIICVADAHNIQALVTSTVYQKFCWGIVLPTIGISIDRLGSVANIIIGWIDERDVRLRPHLPPVHLASSSPQVRVDTSLGIFDLSGPASALQFAQFILGMRYQFSSIQKSLEVPCIQDLCWRMDHVVLSNPILDNHSESNSGTWRENIPQWAHDIVPSDFSEYDPSSFPCLSINSMAKTQHSEGSPSIEHRSHTRIKQSVVSNKGPVVSPSRASSTKASRLAGIDDPLDGDKLGVEHWLWERATMRLGRVEVQNQTKTGMHINGMVDLYNQMFKLAWPRKWTKTRGSNSRASTSCDTLYRPILELLWTQYDDYSKPQNQATVPVPELAEDIFSVIESRISIFLSAVALASARAEQGKQTININEMERRLPVDLILYAFCCPEEMTACDAFFMETQVRLSKNKALTSSIRDVEQSQLWERLALQQLTTLSNMDENYDIQDIASRTFDQAKEKRQKLASSPYKNQLDAKSRSHEPRGAIADSVVCARIAITQPNGPLTSQTIVTSDPLKWSTIFRKFVPQFKTKCKSDAKGASTGRVKGKDGSDKGSSHIDCRMCPFVTEHLPEPDKTMATLLPRPRVHSANELFIPLIFDEYKRNYAETGKAFHQCHLYLISAVDFLVSLGVKDFPIFGVVTAGDSASIMMAWHSSVLPEAKVNDNSELQGGFNIIFDENLISFNLSEPLDAYRFTVGVQRIYRHQEKLKAKLEGKDLTRLLESDAWAMPPKDQLPDDQQQN